MNMLNKAGSSANKHMLKYEVELDATEIMIWIQVQVLLFWRSTLTRHIANCRFVEQMTFWPLLRSSQPKFSKISSRPTPISEAFLRALKKSLHAENMEIPDLDFAYPWRGANYQVCLTSTLTLFLVCERNVATLFQQCIFLSLSGHQLLASFGKNT